MIKFLIKNALVHAVTPVVDIPSKTGGQSFYKRELILDDSWVKEETFYNNFISVEFSNDKISQLDPIRPGQRVNVEAMLSGREYNGRIYNSVRGLSVTLAQAPQQYSPSPAPMPGGYVPQPAYPQACGQTPHPAHMPGAYPQQPVAPGYQRQQQYVTEPAQMQSSYSHQPSSPTASDLPFRH